MATLNELHNEWAEAVSAAQKIAQADDFDASAYEKAWGAVEDAQAKYERANKLDAASAAVDDSRPKVTDLRDPADADPTGREPHVPSVKPTTANTAPEGFVRISPGTIVPYATRQSEGYIRGYPAAVQLPSIMARYGPELEMEAALQREAFLIYARKGASAREFNDERLRRALNALQEDTDSEGGYLVPTDERTSEIVHDPGAPGGVTRPVSRVLTTTRDGGTIPSGTTITWAAIAEEATPTDSDPAFDQIPFTIRKSGFNSTVSEELLADSAFNVPNFLSMVGNEERGRYEDQQSVEGDGTTEPLGIRTTGAAQGNVADITDLLTLAAPTKLELASAFFELPAQFHNAGTRWHTTSSFVARLVAIDAAGGDVSLVPAASGPPQFAYLGVPIVRFDGTGWDNAATIAANEEVGCIGDYGRYYVFMDRLGIIFRRDDSVAFRSDQVAFKMRARYDSFFTENNAFRILKGAAS